MDDARKKAAYKVSIVSIIVNLILFVYKLITGYISGSIAVLADAYHTLSDIVTSILLLVAFKFSSQPPDKSHPYGHGDIEELIAIIIAFALFLVGLNIIFESYEKYKSSTAVKNIFFAILAAVVSIVTKEALYRYTYILGKRINSDALKADAMHHRSDSLSSVAVLVGLGASFFLGTDRLDSLVGILLGIFIVYSASTMGYNYAKKIVGTLADPKMYEQIETIAGTLDQIKEVHSIKIHYIGAFGHVELHMLVDPNMSVRLAHTLADELETKITKEIESLISVSIHVEPCDTDFGCESM